MKPAIAKVENGADAAGVRPPAVPPGALDTIKLLAFVQGVLLLSAGAVPRGFRFLAALPFLILFGAVSFWGLTHLLWALRARRAAAPPAGAEPKPVARPRRTPRRAA